jgi:FSR family fosmidomycin resistance protein-like MFS transporter
MSLFSLGGNAGFALGPVLTTASVLVFGLGGAVVVGLVPVLAAAVLLKKGARLGGLRQRGADAARHAASERPDRWAPFARLTGVISLRSVVHFGLLSLVPAWFVTTLDTSEAVGNAGLTAMLAAGAVGTVVAGHVADRLGRRAILLACLAAVGPALALFVVAPTALAFLLIALVGFTLVGTFAITVVLGQEYLPNRLGMASGVTLGAAIGVGGALAPALGALADSQGLETTMWVIAAIPLAGVALALTLPAERRQVPKTLSPASPSPGRI